MFPRPYKKANENAISFCLLYLFLSQTIYTRLIENHPLHIIKRPFATKKHMTPKCHLIITIVLKSQKSRIDSKFSAKNTRLWSSRMPGSRPALAEHLPKNLVKCEYVPLGIISLLEHPHIIEGY